MFLNRTVLVWCLVGGIGLSLFFYLIYGIGDDTSDTLFIPLVTINFGPYEASSLHARGCHYASPLAPHYLPRTVPPTLKRTRSMQGPYYLLWPELALVGSAGAQHRRGGTEAGGTSQQHKCSALAGSNQGWMREPFAKTRKPCPSHRDHEDGPILRYEKGQHQRGIMTFFFLLQTATLELWMHCKCEA